MDTTAFSSSLRHFLALNYDELEMMNLEMKKMRLGRKPEEMCRKKVLQYLKNEDRIKAVTIAFSNLHGRLHMLDYNKDFFLKSYENLTFDGSSIAGFSELGESDLRFKVDWGSFRWIPADIFGPGKVLVFAFVRNQDGSQYPGDFRGKFKQYLDELYKKGSYTVLSAPEIEGFLFEGTDAEQKYESKEGFTPVTRGGYFNALPQDDLRQFIDMVAEAQRAMGFENEKDHGEVAPAQFEINFKYSEMLDTCDQICLYKLLARQAAKLKGYTASFIPKPTVGVNGSGMHSNISIGKGGQNLFYKKKKHGNLSEMAERFANGIMYYANEMCLMFVPSVNGYRRLDPNFEAPNAIKMSASDRGSMIRIPIGDEKSARIEVRSVSPDVNPYFVYFGLVKAGFAGIDADLKTYKKMTAINEKKRTLHGNIYDALQEFKNSAFVKDILGEENHKKYYELKEEVAHRSPKELGTTIKTSEIMFHHEVTNQSLWSKF